MKIIPVNIFLSDAEVEKIYKAMQTAEEENNQFIESTTIQEILTFPYHGGIALQVRDAIWKMKNEQEK